MKKTKAAAPEVQRPKGADKIRDSQRPAQTNRRNAENPGEPEKLESLAHWMLIRASVAENQRVQVGLGDRLAVRSSEAKHNRVKSRFKDCGGACICEHNRGRSKCVDCGGASICAHSRVRSQYKDCK